MLRPKHIWFVIFVLLFGMLKTSLSSEQVKEIIKHDLLVQIQDKDDSQKLVLIDSIASLQEGSNSFDTLSVILLKLYSNAVQDNNSKLVSKVITQIVCLYHSHKKHELLIHFAENILDNKIEMDTIDRIRFYDLLAFSYLKRRIFDKCLENITLRDALANSIDREERKQLPAFISSINSLYYETGMFRELGSIYSEETKKYLKSGDNYQIANHYNNLALNWQKQNELDSAMYYFNKTRHYILINEDKIDSFFLHLVEGNIGEVLMLKNEYDSAVVLLRKDIESNRLEKKYLYVANSQISLAECYLFMGNPLRALKMLDSTGKYLDYFKTDKLVSKYFLQKSRVFDSLNIVDSALFYAKKYITYTDSVIKVEKEANIINNQIAFATKKKEMLISQQKDELLNERAKVAEEKAHAHRETNIRNISLLLALFTLIMLFVILRSRQKQKKSSLLLEKQNQQLKEHSTFRKAMTSMIAHDLKNPLNTVINLSSKSDNGKQKYIAQAGNNMLNLVMNLLEVDKYEKSTMPLNLEINQGIELVEKAINRVVLLAENKAIALQNMVAEDIFVWADKDSLQRVFVNLLTNAIKYSPVNSVIFVSAQPVKDNFVRFAVTDEGEGIKMEYREKLFDIYFQGDARKSGRTKSNGLGLTFCKMAIEAHGGSIGVESKKDKGSEFWFTLKKGYGDVVAEVSVARKVEPNTRNLEFSVEDRNEIHGIIVQLKEIEYFEITSIRKIMNQINGNASKNISLWRKQLLCAVNSGNEEQYKQLVNI